MNRKGQAAMEYLMTYGWALLVIVIVISVLLLLNIGPQSQCNLDDPSLRCDQVLPVITESGTSKNLHVVLNNGKSNGISVTKMACSKDNAVTPAYVPLASPVNIPAGSRASIKFVCGDAVNLQQGGTFSGKVFIQYKADNDPTGYPERVASGGIVAKDTGAGTVSVTPPAVCGGTTFGTCVNSATPHCVSCSSGYECLATPNVADCSSPPIP